MFTSTVWVVLVSSITMFTIRPSGMMMVPTTEPMAMAAAAGQPTSITDRLNPKRSIISWTAGAKVVPSRLLMTKFRPMKPMPTVSPARRLLPKPAPRAQPKIVMTIGMTTDTPRELIKEKKPKIASIG